MRSAARITKLSAAACGGLLLSVIAAAQSPSLSVTPANPVLSVEQAQQFTLAGAVTPSGVSAGGEYTCLGLSDGTVRCTGRNQFNQLADGGFTNSSMLVASTVASASRVVAGDEFACALLTDSTVTCWGLGESGQRGDGNFQTFSAGPVSVIGLSGAVALATGYTHACVLMADASVQCWGRNVDGELGTGSFADPSTGPPGSAVPVPVSGITNAIAVATGAYHTCAVLSGGTVQCWGLNGQGQLGDGTVADSAVPLTVSGISTAVAVTGGGAHTCALLQDGTVQCWGDNEYGQLGDDGTARGYSPVQVAGINNAVAISGGWRHTCAILADGSVQCWGQNTYGQLGNGTTVSSSTPVYVNGISGAVAVTAGWWHHSCALRNDGTVRCWGANEWGQRGDGTVAAPPLPTVMAGTGVTWSSDNPIVATIDRSGWAVANGSGAATITGTDTSGASASTTMTVRERFALSVVAAGTGAGTVISTPPGINCGTDCSQLYDSGATVTLTATPDSRSTFSSWTGCDTVSGATCIVTMNAARTVTATFNLKKFVLTVTKNGLGAGQGTVTSSPDGIDCGIDCSDTYTIDTVVTLTAGPSLLFSGWTGCDSVSDTRCVVTMKSVRSVTASFLALPF